MFAKAYRVLMYPSVVKVKKIMGLSFSKPRLQSSICLFDLQSSDICLQKVGHAKQKHLGCKKVRGQSEATLQTGQTVVLIC